MPQAKSSSIKKALAGLDNLWMEARMEQNKCSAPRPGFKTSKQIGKEIKLGRSATTLFIQKMREAGRIESAKFYVMDSAGRMQQVIHYRLKPHPRQKTG